MPTGRLEAGHSIICHWLSLFTSLPRRTTKVLAAISLLVFPESNKAEKNQWFFDIHSRDMVVEFDLLSPVGVANVARPLGATSWPSWAFLAHCWPRICWLCGWSKPSVDFKNHRRRLFVQRNILLHCCTGKSTIDTVICV